LMFRTFCNTDVSVPLSDHKYNRWDTDLSLSGRLCLRVPKRVRTTSSDSFLLPRSLLSVALFVARWALAFQTVTTKSRR
jgi:hypothetical protein